MLHSRNQFDSVIPLAVLWQYVKVLLSKHRLELCDVGRQQSSSGLCLLTVSGSFHETLGGGSCGLEVDLSKLQKEACVTIVLWTSSHILYGLPLHQKGDVSKATC